jgi:hypothetical protein
MPRRSGFRCGSGRGPDARPEQPARGRDIGRSGIFFAARAESPVNRRLFSVYQKLPDDITMMGASEYDP